MNRVNVPTLVTGLLCLIVGALGLASTFDVLPLGRHLFAGALIAAGTIGLVVALRYRREDHN